MKTILKCGVLVFASLCMLTSCEEEGIEYEKDSTPKEKLAVFVNMEDFITTYEMLSSSDLETAKEWVETNDFNSLYFSPDICRDDIPFGFHVILNKNMEFQINDSIIKLNNGNLYLVDSQNVEELNDANIIGSIKSDNVEENEPSITRASFELSKTGQTSHQYEFKWNAQTRYKYKYVHEIKSYQISLVGFVRYELALILKMEYKYSDWEESKTENSTRIIETNVSGQASTGFEMYPFAGQEKVNFYGNYYILLAVHYNNLPKWYITFNGTIKQEIIGAPETKWVDTW